MGKKAFFSRAILAFALASSSSLVLGQEASKEMNKEECDDEKGPCCNLDWTGQGATIVKIKGEGLVSQSPYVNATVGMRVNNGGRVLALDRSTVVVGYDDGCWHVLNENEMLTIEDVSPCCAARLPPPVPPPPPAVPAPPALPPISPAWVPAAAGAAVGLCAVTDCFTDDPDESTPERPPISR